MRPNSLAWPAFALLLVLWGAASCLAAPSSYPVTVRDAQGLALTLVGPPRRIVSLAPGTTEMLFALGLGPSVVGDTTYCDYPPAARAVAKIGDVHVSYEKVVALRPDLVVASDANSPAAARLRHLGLPVFAIAPTSYASVESSLLTLGQLTHTLPRARHVVAQMEDARAFAAHLAAHQPQHPTVLAVIGTGPLFVAGRGTFIADLVALSGAADAAAVSGYAPYSKELALAHPSDFVLADPSAQAALEADPVLGRLPAVRARRFIAIPSDILNRPGPRLADALRRIARALHPGARR